MPDCSSATLFLWPIPDLSEPDWDSLGDEARELAEAEHERLEPLRHALVALDVDPVTLARGGGSHFEGEVTMELLEDGSRRVHVSEYEAAWGINQDNFREAIGAARDAGVAFYAQDGGHYTWDPYDEWWHPGMDGPATRQSSIDAGAVISLQELGQLAEGCATSLELADRIRDLLKFDPLGWRPPAAATLPSSV